MSPNKVFLISAPGKVFEGATSSALLEKGVASFLLYGKAASRRKNLGSPWLDVYFLIGFSWFSRIFDFCPNLLFCVAFSQTCKQCFYAFSASDIRLYHSESIEIMLQRWTKLEKDFKKKSGAFDVSKIPDIYDCIKYGLLQ